MEYGLSDKVYSIVSHFGLEKQKEKLVEEILEFEIALRIMCLLIINEKTKSAEDLVNNGEAKKSALSDVVEEFADVVLVSMQMHRLGFNKMFDLVTRNNSKHLRMLESNGYIIDRQEVYRMVLKKIDRTIDNYDIKLIKER